MLPAMQQYTVHVPNKSRKSALQTNYCLLVCIMGDSGEHRQQMSEEDRGTTAAKIETVGKVFCQHSTAPMWDHTNQMLYFIDVTGNAVHRFHPESQFHDVLRFERDRKVVFVALADSSEQLLIGCGNAVLKVDIAEDNKMQLDRNSYVHMDFSFDISKYRMTLGKVSPYGELFFAVEPADRGKGFSAGASGDSTMYRMMAPKEKRGVSNPQYVIEEAVLPSKAPVMPRGLCWDHGGRSLYVTDASERKLLRYVSVPFRSTLENREDVIDLTDISSGAPGGVAVDSKGCVWVAMEGSGDVVCIDPSKGFGLGRVMHKIRMPVKNITSCTFGGHKLDHLYVTSRRSVSASGAKVEGSVFRVTIPGRHKVARIIKSRKS